jgi:hypothetical protein
MNKFAILSACLAAVALNSCGSKKEVDTPEFNACSNNLDIINLPFLYDVDTDQNRILVESFDGTGQVYVHFSPFGAHFKPMTDRAYGDNKVNFVGFFSESDEDIKDLTNGERGFWAEADATELHRLRPMYITRGAGKITRIDYVGPADVTYLDDQYWMITLKYGDFEVKLDHIGKLSEYLNNTLIEYFGFDSYTYEPDPANYGNIFDVENFAYSYLEISGIVPVGYPQVRASIVPGQSINGWYNGAGSPFEDRPNIQIEYSVSAPTENGSRDVCLFELLSTAREAKFQRILDNDLTSLNSQFYNSTYADTAWQWRAESSACVSCSTHSDGLNGLYKDLGGWFEDSDSEDELISFIPIATDSQIGYDATLYNNNGGVTEWLILRRNLAELFTWQMQDMSIIEANYPAGEIITIEDDALLVEWRDLEAAGSGTSAFQWLCYDITDSVVTIKFGEFKDSMTSREVVLDLAVDTPDGIKVIAYVKDKISGF